MFYFKGNRIANEESGFWASLKSTWTGHAAVTEVCTSGSLDSSENNA